LVGRKITGQKYGVSEFAAEPGLRSREGLTPMPRLSYSYKSSKSKINGIDRNQLGLIPAAAARCTRASRTAGAFARLVAVAAKHWTVPTRFKRHSCRLAATRTNHGRSRGRSRTVARAPLIVLFCLTAILATFWGRITTFLEERLICSCEGEVLPAIAAR
jgi:hypothetical protein